jgi:short-subunit dehydrogenase
MRGTVSELQATTVDLLTTGNIHSAVWPTVAVLPELLKSGGAVIFVSTVAAIHGFPGVSLYSATKAAVGTFAESLTAEVSRRGVHVGTVFLGFVENDPDKTTLGADGHAFHHERRAMQSQSHAAGAIVRALLRRKRRTITVGAGRWLDLAHRVAPGLVSRILARSGGRLHSVDGHE